MLSFNSTYAKDHPPKGLLFLARVTPVGKCLGINDPIENIKELFLIGPAFILTLINKHKIHTGPAPCWLLQTSFSDLSFFMCQNWSETFSRGLKKDFFKCNFLIFYWLLPGRYYMSKRVSLLFIHKCSIGKLIPPLHLSGRLIQTSDFPSCSHDCAISILMPTPLPQNPIFNL